MFYIFRQWRFVRFLNREIRKRNRELPDDAIYGQDTAFSAQILIDEYRLRQRVLKIRAATVSELTSSCLRNGFLDERELDGNLYLTVDSSKGRKFLSVLGLVEEELEQFSGAVQFVFGGGIASIIWIIVRIVK